MTRPAMLLRRLFPLLCLAAPGFLLAVPLQAFAVPAWAERIDLAPPVTRVSIRFYGIGFLPIDGNYTRFQGWLAYDPNDRAHCQAELKIDATSLAMASASVRDDVVGPEFMDATRYPTLTFEGACHGRTLDGVLTMHGVSHTFGLSLDWQAKELTATGSLQRAEWAMTQHLFLGGSTVRIQVTTGLPAAGEGAGR